MKLDPPMLTEGPLSGRVYIVTHGKISPHPTIEGETMVEASVKYDITDQFEALAAHRAEPEGQRITHGRHCICSACAREDWTNPDLAPCGMHGSDCPALYQPWGMAGGRFAPGRDAPSSPKSDSP